MLTRRPRSPFHFVNDGPSVSSATTPFSFKWMPPPRPFQGLHQGLARPLCAAPRVAVHRAGLQ